MYKYLPLLLITSTLYAQPDSSRLLQDVVIQSNRIQTGFDETAASVIVIPAKEIKQAPALSVPDLLHYYAGVDIRQRGANGVQADAGIRGSTFDQVLILINGIKISDQQTGHHSLNLPVDIENIERIEILKGPAARIFGQNAFAGAINIITKTPDSDQLKVQAIGGDFGLGGFRLSAGMVNEKVSHYLSAAHDFSDGYKYNTDYKISNFFYQSKVNTRHGKLGILAGYTDRDFGANGFYANSAYEDQRESVQTSLMALTFQNQLKQNISLTHRLYWRRNFDDYIFNWKNPTAYRNIHLNNTVGYELNSSITNKLGVTGLGVDVSQLWLRSSNLGDHERTVATLFVEHRFNWLDQKLNATPGIQLNYYSDFGTNFFPGIDLGYSVSKAVKLFGNVGYTYRVPTYTDLYYNDPANLGNPNLQPEYAISYEGGVKLFASNLYMQASYFLRNGNQIIDWTKQNESDPWQAENLMNVNMSGIDLNFEWKPANLPVELSGGYTYINAKAVTDQQYSRYALENLNHQVVAGTRIRYTRQLIHSINYRYSNRENLDDYNVVDTRLTWQGKTWGTFMDVTNVFDEVYKETNLVTMPGRWFKIGVNYQLIAR